MDGACSSCPPPPHPYLEAWKPGPTTWQRRSSLLSPRARSGLPQRHPGGSGFPPTHRQLIKSSASRPTGFHQQINLSALVFVCIQMFRREAWIRNVQTRLCSCLLSLLPPACFRPLLASDLHIPNNVVVLCGSGKDLYDVECTF